MCLIFCRFQKRQNELEKSLKVGIFPKHSETEKYFLFLRFTMIDDTIKAVLASHDAENYDDGNYNDDDASDDDDDASDDFGDDVDTGEDEGDGEF